MVVMLNSELSPAPGNELHPGPSDNTYNIAILLPVIYYQEAQSLHRQTTWHLVCQPRQNLNYRYPEKYTCY